MADLRRLRLCAQSATTGADVIAKRVRPTRAPPLFGDTSSMLLNLGLGAATPSSTTFPRSRR